MIIDVSRTERVDVSLIMTLFFLDCSPEDNHGGRRDLQDCDDGCDLRSALHPCATMAVQKLHTLIYGRRKRELLILAFLAFSYLTPSEN